MTKTAHKALLESIEKWRQIERGEMADCGTNNCSLCMEFYAVGCLGCPVEEAGHMCCQGTPYEKWAYQFDDEDYGYVADTPELVRLARAERKFLESLLP